MHINKLVLIPLILFSTIVFSRGSGEIVDSFNADGIQYWYKITQRDSLNYDIILRRINTKKEKVWAAYLPYGLYQESNLKEEMAEFLVTGIYPFDSIFTQYLINDSLWGLDLLVRNGNFISERGITTGYLQNQNGMDSATILLRIDKHIYDIGKVIFGDIIIGAGHGRYEKTLNFDFGEEKRINFPIFLPKGKY